MTRTDRGNHSSPFRRSLRFKLMLAFGIVGLIGYIAPLQVLPRLYVWSQNRDIDLANPINTALLRNHFVAIVKTRAEAFSRSRSPNPRLTTCWRFQPFMKPDFLERHP